MRFPDPSLLIPLTPLSPPLSLVLFRLLCSHSLAKLPPGLLSLVSWNGFDEHVPFPRQLTKLHSDVDYGTYIYTYDTYMIYIYNMNDKLKR